MKQTLVTFVVRTQDNGDGSHSATFYDSIGQMLDNHELYQEEPTEEVKEEILNNDLDYQDYGGITQTTAKFDFKSNTDILLHKPFSVETGNQ